MYFLFVFINNCATWTTIKFSSKNKYRETEIYSQDATCTEESRFENVTLIGHTKARDVVFERLLCRTDTINDDKELKFLLVSSCPLTHDAREGRPCRSVVATVVCLGEDHQTDHIFFRSVLNFVFSFS